MPQEGGQCVKAGCPNSSRMFIRDGREGNFWKQPQRARRMPTLLLALKVCRECESMFKARFEEEISDLDRA